MFDYDLQKPRYSPWAQLSILLMLTGLGLLIGSFVTLGIAESYLHVPPENLSEALENATDPNLSRLLQFISTFFIMALPSFVFARIMNFNAFKYIGFNNAINYKQVFIIAAIVFLGLILSETLSQVNEMIPISKSAQQYFKGMEDRYNKEMLGLANMKTVTDYIISLVIIALLPALFEEMLFRGCLQPVMINLTRNAFVGILITSVLFSAVHVSYYGFLPRLGLGLIIGYVFYLSRNLWLSSIAHFFYNAYGVTQLYALSKKGLLTTDAMKDGSFPLYYGLLAAIALVALFIFFKKESDIVITAFNQDHAKNIEETSE